MVKRFLLNQRIYRRIGEKRAEALPDAATAALRKKTHSRGLLLAAGGIAVAAIVAGGVLLLAAGTFPVTGSASSAAAASSAAEPGDSSPRGSGISVISREKDIEHTVLDGETFSEIAYIYNVGVGKLALYNRVEDINRIKEGMTILIPSEEAEKGIVVDAAREARRLAATTVSSKRAAAGVPLKINMEEQFDGTAVTAHFSVNVEPRLTLARFEWDLGNGRKSFRPTTFWTYDVPGTYKVTLKATDSEGREHRARAVFVDVPHPATYQSTHQQFLTLENLEETFTIQGTISNVVHYDGKPGFPLTEVGSNAQGTVYKATRPGFFALDVQKGDSLNHLYVFVSPVDSRHSDRTDINWYRTQFNTGTLSNCGPAVVSMAIAWATGAYVPVAALRQDIGWSGNGGTSYEDLVSQLKRGGVTYRLVSLSSPRELFDIIDRDGIAIVLLNTGRLAPVKGRPTEDLFGRYYYDAVGHYIIVKGYSKDGQYVVAYDPIPSDWGSNSMRYGDGISMIGRNRYYAAKDLFGSLRRWDVIEVLR